MNTADWLDSQIGNPETPPIEKPEVQNSVIAEDTGTSSASWLDAQLGTGGADVHNITKDVANEPAPTKKESENEYINRVFNEGVSEQDKQQISAPGNPDIEAMLRRGQMPLGKAVTAQQIEKQGPQSDMPDFPPEVAKGFEDRPDWPTMPSSKYDEVWDWFRDVKASAAAGGSVTRDSIRALFNANQAVPTFDDKGNVVEVRLETDEEKTQRTIKETEARRNKLGAPDKGTGADIVGDLLNDLADPVGMMTFGAATSVKTAKAVTRLGKLFLAGSSFGATAETLDQKVNDGEIHDVKAIATRGLVDGIAVPVFDVLIRHAGKVIEKVGINNANKLLDKVERAYFREKALGINSKAAYNRAIAKMDIDPDKILVTQVKAGRQMDLRLKSADSKLADAPLREKYTAAVRDSFVGMSTRRSLENVGDFLTPLTTRIGKIWNPGKFELRRMVQNTHLRLIKTDKELDTFMRMSNKVMKNKKDNPQMRKIWRSLMEGDRLGARRLMRDIADRPIGLKQKLTGKTESMVQAFDRVIPVIDQMGKELVASGAIKPEALLKGFFPRVVKDHTAFKKILTGKQYGKFEEALDKAGKLKNRDLDNLEVSNILNKVLKEAGLDIKPATNPTKARKISTIEEKILDQYMEPDAALGSYFSHTIHKLERQKMFQKLLGGKVKYNDAPVKNIHSLLQKAVNDGEIAPGDQGKLATYLDALLNAGQNQMSKGMQDLKNIFYMGTLGNHVATVTQFGDLGIAGIVNGIGNVLETITSKMKIHPTDIGIALDRVAQEMETTTSTAKMLSKVLQLTSFRLVDRLGKTVLINSSLRKFNKQAMTRKGAAKIRSKYQDAFTPKEMDDVLHKLRAGEVDENIKFMLFNELSDAQPISMLEMPLRYATSKNGRMFYMLKTFTIKQFDIMRRQALDKIANGQTSKGVYELARFNAIMVAAGMGTEDIKDMMRGRTSPDVEDRLTAMAWRNFSASEGIRNKVAKGDVIGAGLDLVLPPIGMAKSFGEDIVNLSKGQIETMEDIKALPHYPVAGKFLHDWYGGGIEKHAKRMKADKRRKAKDE